MVVVAHRVLGGSVALRGCQHGTLNTILVLLSIVARATIIDQAHYALLKYLADDMDEH